MTVKLPKYVSVDKIKKLNKNVANKYIYNTRKQSETADLRQRHVVRQVQHYIRFGSGFPYASLKAMLTKISK